MIRTAIPAWFDAAACRGMDPGVFYPSKGEVARQEAAFTICGGCAVRLRCLDYSFTIGDAGRQGIWGGMSERGRRRLNNERRSKPSTMTA